MKKLTKIKISSLITIIHFIIGNIISHQSVIIIIEIIFLPYTFIAGLSNFAGWDTLSYILELGSFIIIFAIVYGIVTLLSPRSRKHMA